MEPDPYVSALRAVADAATEYMGARMLFEAGGSPFELRLRAEHEARQKLFSAVTALEKFAPQPEERIEVTK